MEPIQSFRIGVFPCDAPSACGFRHQAAAQKSNRRGRNIVRPKPLARWTTARRFSTAPVADSQRHTPAVQKHALARIAKGGGPVRAVKASREEAVKDPRRTGSGHPARDGGHLRDAYGLGRLGRASPARPSGRPCAPAGFGNSGHQATNAGRPTALLLLTEGLQRRPVCLNGSPWQNLLLPVRDRLRNLAAGPMDGRPGQARVVKLVCRGACREFSDYDCEGVGGPSGWARLRCRTDALCKYPDVERIGRCGGRPRAHQSSKFLPIHLCCGTTAVGRSRIQEGSFSFRWKRRSPPARKSRSNRPDPP
jgi:hypothetical protein